MNEPKRLLDPSDRVSEVLFGLIMVLTFTSSLSVAGALPPASTLPVAIPFVFLRDAILALRVSNGVAVAMLFACGYSFGRLTRFHPWWTGLGMVFLGSLLASMTMVLGG